MQTCRVVVIDDSEIIRERLTKLLGSLDGVEIVGEADNGEAGLALLLQAQPDVAILDLRMPGINGLNVMHQARGAACETEFIVLTNFPFTEYRTRCRELGATHFF